MYPCSLFCILSNTKAGLKAAFKLILKQYYGSARDMTGESYELRRYQAI